MWNTFTRHLGRFFSTADHYLSDNQWILAFLLLLVVGLFFMRGFGSRKNY